jgi:hypothetical protein
MEMTTMCSVRRPNDNEEGISADAEVADDFVADIGATLVDEDRPGWEDDEEEKEQKADHTMSPPLHHSSHLLALPAIDEGQREQSSTITPHSRGVWTEDVDAKIREEEKQDAPMREEAVVEMVHDDERGEVWHVVSKDWEKYRIPAGWAVLAIMVTLSLLALDQQIQASVS